MTRILAISCAAVLAAGCATVDYVGQSYSPTTHVDIFFSEADVPHPYVVMGKVLASGDQFTSAERLNRALIARAREKGADAVIVLDVSRTPMSDAQQIVETTTVSGSGDEKTIEKKREVESTAALHNEIRATFIKYK